MSLVELQRGVEARGYRILGRASKELSDALRSDIRSGRVRREKRGIYSFTQMPRTTEYSMRQRVRAYDTFVVADMSDGKDR